MPPKKRKQRSATQPVRRNSRRSPVPPVDQSQAKSASASPARNSKKSSKVRQESELGSGNEKVGMDVMHTITHHTSFVPVIASLRGMSSMAQSSIANHGMNPNALVSNMMTKSSNDTNATTRDHNQIDTSNSRPYALYHPRNLGLVPPTITHPPEGTGKVVIPHSAGCRMKYLPEPTFRSLPVHPDYNNDEYILMSGLTCPTVINNSHSSSGQIAVGDTGGHITLYATLPVFLPINKLDSSASQRFAELHPKGRQKKKKRIGRSQAIVGSSIDRSNAIETMVILPHTGRVLVGTRMEIECISFDNEIQWTMTWPWHLDGEDGDVDRMLGWDGFKKKNMIRGIPMRLHANRGDDFVLASFAFFRIKDGTRDHLKSNPTDKSDDENDGNCHDDQVQEEQHDQRPELHSPILKIDVITGKFTNVVPLQEDKEAAKAMDATEWKECIIGDRAMAIYDKLHCERIIGVFLTHGPPCAGSTTSVETAPKVIQELMVLDEDNHILHRTVVPTKSSGSKIVSVEAINQSPHGDFTIAANAKGGVRVYATNGLQLLGAYGEGVSLHGHSIVWQDIFFIRIDSAQNDDDDKGKQEQWGQILERQDELTHRGNYETKRKEKYKKTDVLNELYIVSVPSAFREPVDMMEHIQFWDVSKIEFDGGNKLPSFELLAPKKSEGICTLIFDDSIMTSNSGRFLMSTHAGDCFEMTPTLATDWAGQMYPTGYLVIDNNIAYIEDEDELDQVVDNNFEQGDFCQSTGSSTKKIGKQDEVELKLALQMSMQDEIVDVIGTDDDENWRSSVVNVAPCRPQVHLTVKAVTEKDKKQGEETIDSPRLNTFFDLMKLLPSYEAVKKELSAEIEVADRRQSLIEAAKLKVNDEPIKIPRRKQGNIDFVISACVDKKLAVKLLEKMGRSDGSGSSLQISRKNRDGSSSMTSSDSKNDGKRKEKDCPACQGRFVTHACGKRAHPIDYDAIAKAELEIKEEEETKKKQLQTEKRKVAERRRNEKKLKLKMEKEEAHLRKEAEDMERKQHSASLDLTVADDSNESSYTQQQPTDSLTYDQNSPEKMQYEDSVTHSSNDQHVQQREDEHSNLNAQNKISQYDHPLYDQPQYSYQQQHQNSSSHIPHNEQEHYSSTSMGTVNFGDSMLSNIPSLPSEPSSYYRSNNYGGQDPSH
jgi:hypothetical protein